MQNAYTIEAKLLLKEHSLIVIIEIWDIKLKKDFLTLIITQLLTLILLDKISVIKQEISQTMLILAQKQS